MLRDDRRMQEGARDLAIAFNIGRAEEALSRINLGATLREQDLRFFQQLGNLFGEALRGVQWVEGTLSGTSSPVASESLTAFQLLLPVLEVRTTNESPADFLSSLISVSTSLVEGKQIPDDERVAFSTVLKALSIAAVRQGMDSLEPKTTPSSFSILPKVQ